MVSTAGNWAQKKENLVIGVFKKHEKEKFTLCTDIYKQSDMTLVLQLIL